MKTKESEPLNILFADDDEDDLFLFQQAVKEAHPKTKLKMVEDGQQLMQYLASADGNHPDVIFMDINMPGKNGIECLKEIRSNKQLNKVPVIIFSTSSYKKDIEETFKNGANLYVTKPSDYKDEVNILKKILALDIQKDLLTRNKDRFVMYTTRL